jgi:hypothetical protein
MKTTCLALAFALSLPIGSAHAAEQLEKRSLELGTPHSA